MFKTIWDVLSQSHDFMIDMYMKSGSFASREAANLNFLIHLILILVLLTVLNEVIITIQKNFLRGLKMIFDLLHWGIRVIDRKVIFRWNHSKGRHHLVALLRKVFPE